MILTNLANIFVTRKKKELIVMRINGFSIKQTINYLARETVITIIIGLIIGLAIGIPLGFVAMNIMEPVEVYTSSNSSKRIKKTLKKGGR